MILQRTRPPLLETPFDVFGHGVFTPDDRFFVRWHWADIPESVDVASFRLAVCGQVNRELSLSLPDLLSMPRVELAAVNQCSGNSRGEFEPRVPGAQWASGSMSNAKWVGVRLRDVLDRAGVKASARFVRFNGLDQPIVVDKDVEAASPEPFGDAFSLASSIASWIVVATPAFGSVRPAARPMPAQPPTPE